MELVPITLKTPKTIAYHISDIHIRYNMKDDTREDIIFAFDRLLELINAEENPVFVVVTGDIYDVANRINPEELLTFHICFGKLADCPKIKKIITIPGNHDYLLDPKNNIVHASLISSRYNDKILHFNENTSVILDDVQFVIVANPKSAIQAAQFEDSKEPTTKVLLLHETIKGAVINQDTNYIYSGEGRDVSEFAEYHAVMMGDIHKQQFIGRETVAYAGSLIQRNFGEDLLHGTLRWELNGPATSCKFIPLKLRRAYIIRKALNNKMINKIDTSLYEKPKKVKLIYENCEQSFVNACLRKIPEIYGKLDSVINNGMSLIERESLEGLEGEKSPEPKISNLTLRNIFNIDEIIQEHLLKMYPDPKESDDPKQKNKKLREKLLKIHNEMLEKIVLGIGKFKLLKLAWKNVFCYGENNVIDFTKLSGISSIIGKNGVGKSSIIGILCFVLYDEKFGALNVLNTRAESGEYEITCIFEVEGDVYKVIKSNKKSDGLEIFKNNKKLKFKSKPDMKNAIREIIGDSKNVLRNNIAMQTHEMYLDKSQNIFRNELLGYLNLLEYSKLPDKIKEQTLPIQRKIAELNKEIKDSKYTSDDLEGFLEKERANLAKIEAQKDVIFSERDAVIKKYLEKSDSAHVCNEYCPNPSNALQEIEKLKSEIFSHGSLGVLQYEETDKSPETLISEIELIERNLVKIKEAQDDTNAKLNNMRDCALTLKNIPFNKEFPSEESLASQDDSIDEYTKALDSKTKLLGEVSEIEKEIRTLERQMTSINEPKTSFGSLKEVLAQIESLVSLQSLESREPKTKQYKWNEKCACCMHNMGIINGNDTKEKLENLNNDVEYYKNLELGGKVAECRKSLDELRNKIAVCSNIILIHDAREYYSNQKIKNSINTLKTKKEKIDRLEVAEKQKLAQTKKMLNFAKNAAILRTKPMLAGLVKCYNNRVDIEYNEINSKYNIIVVKVKECVKKISDIEKQIDVIKRYEMLREQKYNLEEELSTYGEYRKLVDIQSGIPAIILQKYIPILNQDVNIMLEKLVDYRIKIDESCNITDASTRISAVQMSGSQKFIVDLILRLCLINNHPYLPEFLIIDEGFGSLDNESLIEMCAFIEKINNYVKLQFLIVISHVEELNQIAKTKLVIQRKDNMSLLCYE